MVEVFLDLDGVLVDLVSGLCRYHKIENPFNDPKNYGRYDVRHMAGMSSESFWGVLDHDFWLDLDWTDFGRSILNEVLKYVPVKQVTILTAPTGFPGCVDGKISWVNKHLPRFNYFVGRNKKAIAGPNKLLIDDHDVNIDEWTEAGGPAIHVPLLSNRLYHLPTLSYVKEKLENYFNRTG